MKKILVKSSKILAIILVAMSISSCSKPTEEISPKDDIEVSAFSAVDDFVWSGLYGNNEGYSWEARQYGESQDKEYEPRRGSSTTLRFRAPRAGFYMVRASFQGYKEGGSNSSDGTISLRGCDNWGVEKHQPLVSVNVPKGGGWVRGTFNNYVILDKGDYLFVKMEAGCVGAINRWARYIMEYMDVTYIEEKQITSDMFIDDFTIEYPVIQGSVSIPQPIILQ